MTESLQSSNAFSFFFLFHLQGTVWPSNKIQKGIFHIGFLLIDNKYGEAEKVQHCEKNNSPQQIQIIRKHIFIFNMTTSLQEVREQQHVPSPKRKRHPFFHNTTSDMLKSET